MLGIFVDYYFKYQVFWYYETTEAKNWKILKERESDSTRAESVECCSAELLQIGSIHLCIVYVVVGTHDAVYIMYVEYMKKIYYIILSTGTMAQWCVDARTTFPT